MIHLCIFICTHIHFRSRWRTKSRRKNQFHSKKRWHLRKYGRCVVVRPPCSKIWTCTCLSNVSKITYILCTYLLIDCWLGWWALGAGHLMRTGVNNMVLPIRKEGFPPPPGSLDIFLPRRLWRLIFSQPRWRNCDWTVLVSIVLNGISAGMNSPIGRNVAHCSAHFNLSIGCIGSKLRSRECFVITE